MHADRDDLPQYLQRNTGNAARWIVAVIAASGITLGALYIGSKSMGQNHTAAISEKLSREEAWRKEQAKQQARNARIEAEKEELRNWWKKDEAHWQRSTEASQQEAQEGERTFTKEMLDKMAGRTAPITQPRQNSFNDGNYTPQGTRNIVGSDPVRQTEAYPRPSQSQGTTTSHLSGSERARIKQWSGPIWYDARWSYSSNRIDSRSVCTNHGRGSVDYRECRKAAKQYFRDQCKVFRDRYDRERSDSSYVRRERYCSAASVFNPLG